MDFPSFSLGRTLTSKLRHYLNGVSGGPHFIPNGPMVRELDFGEFVQAVHDLGAAEAAKGAALVAVDTALGFAGSTVRAALGELLDRVVALEAGGGGGGSGDVVSAGQAGGQSIQGSSNGTGTLTLSSGSSDPVLVDGIIQADEVRTGDLVMESPARNARWRLIEHHQRIEAVNEITGERMEVIMLDRHTAALLRRYSRLVTRIAG